MRPKSGRRKAHAESRARSAVHCCGGRCGEHKIRRVRSFDLHREPREPRPARVAHGESARRIFRRGYAAPRNARAAIYQTGPHWLLDHDFRLRRAGSDAERNKPLSRSAPVHRDHVRSARSARKSHSALRPACVVVGSHQRQRRHVGARVHSHDGVEITAQRVDDRHAICRRSPRPPHRMRRRGRSLMHRLAHFARRADVAARKCPARTGNDRAARKRIICQSRHRRLEKVVQRKNALRRARAIHRDLQHLARSYCHGNKALHAAGIIVCRPLSQRIHRRARVCSERRVQRAAISIQRQRASRRCRPAIPHRLDRRRCRSMVWLSGLRRGTQICPIHAARRTGQRLRVDKKIIRRTHADRVHADKRRRARQIPERIRDRHRVISLIHFRHTRDRVARRSRPADVRAIQPPLISQRRSARSRHRKRQRISSHQNRPRWLRHDDRRTIHIRRRGIVQRDTSLIA